MEKIKSRNMFSFLEGFSKKPMTKNGKIKTMNDLIDEIHETFNTEVDRILLEAGMLKETEKLDEDFKEKSLRLKALGFNATEEVSEYNNKLRIVGKIQHENELKREMRDTVLYFSKKYPNYKFITESSVKRICEKYSLVYSTVGRYIGTVPLENINEMEKFKIDDYDKCWESKEISYYSHRGPKRNNISRDGAVIGIKREKEYQARSPHSYSVNTSYKVLPLEIAAPMKDFNLDSSEVKDFKLSSKIEIPDPVVLQPVFYGNKKHYLIATAWGKEAEDDLVKN